MLFNIKYGGIIKEKDLSKLEKREIGDAILLDEPNWKMRKVILQGTVISLPLFIIIGYVLITYIDSLSLSHSHEFDFLLYMVVFTICFVVSIPVHELIHAFCCPKEAKKDIYFLPLMGAALMHCTADMSKRRFIVLGVMPALVLPLVFMVIIAFFWEWLPHYALIAIEAIVFVTFIGGVGDFFNIHMVVNKVPVGGHVFMSGQYTYCVNEPELKPLDARPWFVAAVVLAVLGIVFNYVFVPVSIALLVASLVISSFVEYKYYSEILKWVTLAFFLFTTVFHIL